jgi:hypothetical protein
VIDLLIQRRHGELAVVRYRVEGHALGIKVSDRHLVPVISRTRVSAQQAGEHGVSAVPPVCAGALSPARVAAQCKATAIGLEPARSRLSIVDRVRGAPVVRIIVIR